MRLTQAQLGEHLSQCHRCKDWSQVHHGGCAGPCPCLWDGKDIIEHAQTGYCPAGRYPFAGLGSVLGWIFWHLRLPQILRWLKLFNPEKCNCPMRQHWLNRIGRKLFFWRKD